jgi:hypothetical protein
MAVDKIRYDTTAINSAGDRIRPLDPRHRSNDRKGEHHDALSHFGCDVGLDWRQSCGTPQLQLVNPHSFIVLDVKDASGKSLRWRGELGSPAVLKGWCWTNTTLKTGDKITMRGRRLKNGQPFMTLSEQARVIDATGKEIFRGNEPGQPDPPGPCSGRGQR